VRALFFHGGPGFSSNPEKHLLQDVCARAGVDLRLWNEPSAQRPAGPSFRAERAFENYLEQAEQFLLENSGNEPVALVGHSFGAHPVRHLAAKYAAKVAKAVYVCPGLSLSDIDENIFAVAQRDFADHGDDRHLQLRDVLEQHTGKFDDNTLTGFGLASQNPRLFEYYWHDRARMAEYFRYNQGPEYGLDIGAFMAVRSSTYDVGEGDSPVPAEVILGAHDVIASKPAELALLREGHRQVTVHDFEGSGHYAHIEEPARFVRVLEAA
jgi:pimeloyl-ACP methyl ester carboxylesterase